MLYTSQEYPARPALPSPELVARSGDSQLTPDGIPPNPHLHSADNQHKM